MGFVGALVVLFLLMMWVGLGSVVVVFGWVISLAIVLRVCRLHDVDDLLRTEPRFLLNFFSFLHLFFVDFFFFWDFFFFKGEGKPHVGGSFSEHSTLGLDASFLL